MTNTFSLLRKKVPVPAATACSGSGFAWSSAGLLFQPVRVRSGRSGAMAGAAGAEDCSACFRFLAIGGEILEEGFDFDLIDGNLIVCL